MIVVDAIFGSGDRHAGNFGWLRDTKTGEYLSMAPLYDFNHALDSESVVDRMITEVYWRAELCSAPPVGRAELRSDKWPRPPSLGLRPIHLVPLRKARPTDTLFSDLYNLPGIAVEIMDFIRAAARRKMLSLISITGFRPDCILFCRCDIQHINDGFIVHPF